MGAAVGGLDAALNKRDILAGIYKGALAALAIYFTWNLAPTSSWFGMLSAPHKWAGFASAISGPLIGASTKGGSFVENFVDRALNGHTILGAAVSNVDVAIEQNLWNIEWNGPLEALSYSILMGAVIARIPALSIERGSEK